MLKIAIIPNLDKKNADIGVMLTSKKLNEIGIDSYLPISCKDKFGDQYKYLNDNEIYKICDIMIAVGGDGTIIHTSKLAAEFDRPVLGINTGRIGYMAGLELNELDCLDAIKSGKYTVEKRMMLEGTVSGNKERKYYALNDIVVSKDNLSGMIDLYVFNENKSFIGYRADGLVVSTPTGSTAYSMSAGGPIVDPSIKSIILTPICPHSLSARSIILNGNSTLRVRAEARKGNPFVSFDGDDGIQLFDSDYVEIKSSDITTKLIKIKDDSFYSIISKKLTPTL